MNPRVGVKRARTLLRVAEVQQRQALLEAAAARRALEKARLDAAEARQEVSRVAAAYPASGAELLDRQSRALLAAAAFAHMSRLAAEAEMLLRERTAEVAAKSVAVKGRERLLEKRQELVAAEELRRDQRQSDEAGQLGHLNREERQW